MGLFPLDGCSQGGHPRRKTVSCLLSFLFLLYTATGEAAFSSPALSGPAQGMAGCFTAKADHVSALLINPAGLSRLPQAEASFLHAVPFASVPGVSVRQEFLAAALPLGPRWTLGLGASSFNAGDLMKEQELLVGLTRLVTPRLALGLNASYLRHSYDLSGNASLEQDPVFAAGRAKAAVGVDAGLLYSPASFLSLGASVRHLNRPDVGLAARDRVPLEARAGVLWRLGRVHLLADVLRRDAGADVARGRQDILATGLEWAPVPRLALRAGAARGRLTSGLGLAFGPLRLDYAWGLFRSSADDPQMDHRLGLTGRFGKGR